MTEEENRARSWRDLWVILRHTDLKLDGDLASLRGFKLESDVS